MSTITLRDGTPTPSRRSDSANEPIFSLVRSHAEQPDAAFDSVEIDEDVDFDDEVRIPRPPWWRRLLAFVLFVLVLAAAAALLMRAEARQEILRWATFGHADAIQHWLRALRTIGDSVH